MIHEDFEDGDLEAELYLEINAAEIEAIKLSMNEQEYMENQLIMKGGEYDALGLAESSTGGPEGDEINREAEDSISRGVRNGENDVIPDLTCGFTFLRCEEATHRRSRL